MRVLGFCLLASCAFEGRAQDGSATCDNGALDGDETATDCGGTCGPCGLGLGCAIHDDCKAAVCDAGVCRPPVQCNELHQAHRELLDGRYVIDPDGTGEGTKVATFCDMTVDDGGWTLIGKVDGEHAMAATWLVSAVDVEALATPEITASSYACLDAVHLAVGRSAEMRLTNSDRTRWTKWPLPIGRDATTFWRHATGQTVVAAAPQLPVSVTSSEGTIVVCYQNVHGIMPHPGHGGAYPYTSYNIDGNTVGQDYCMGIGTTLFQTALDGFDQNGNGFDAPADETTWPNPAYHIPPHVAVWVR